MTAVDVFNVVEVGNFCTFLKLLQHGIQFGVIKDKVQWMIVELGDGGHGSAVIWINKSQVLHVENFYDVGPASQTHTLRIVSQEK